MRSNGSRPGAPAGESSVLEAAPPTVLDPEPVPAAAPGPAAGGKLSRREKKQKRDATRPLDSWERYRALTDALDEALELVDLADHKGRFALVIMAALNVALFFGITRANVFTYIPEGFEIALGAYLFLYLLTALYFFVQAIETMRPRKEEPQIAPQHDVPPEFEPKGIRYYNDVLRRAPHEYQQVWRHVNIGQLNSELALQVHALSAINRHKYAALRKLYRGLQILIVLATGALILSATAALWGQRELKQLRGNSVLPTAERFPDIGVREPSGIAYNATLGQLIVVGDEGHVVQFDSDGHVSRRAKVRGDLEDVAVHTPTGLVYLLSERPAELILYDPSSSHEKKRWKLDASSLLGRTGERSNHGFEGMTFQEDASRPGGGLLYLTHQSSPALIVALAFDPATTEGTLDERVVVSRWPLHGHRDLSAVSYVPSLDRLLVVAEVQDRLVVVRPDGRRETEISLPGKQQEGLAVDNVGDLWIADDQGGVLRLPGALAALEHHLGGPGARPAPVPASPSAPPPPARAR